MTDWAKLTSGLEHALTLDEGAAQAFLEATIEGDDRRNTDSKSEYPSPKTYSVIMYRVTAKGRLR